MKRILTFLFIIPLYFANAQKTTKQLFDALPAIPVNICAEKLENMEKFELDIREIEITINALKSEEKKAVKAEESRCEFNLSCLTDEALVAKLTALGDELENYRIQLNDDSHQIIQEKTEVEAPLNLDYSDKMYELSQEYWEIKNSGGNVQTTKNKMISMLKIRCDTLSKLRLRQIRMTNEFFTKYWDTYVRMNAIQDEIAHISYSGYSCSIKDGGYLLDAVKSYIEVLRNAYEFHPINNKYDNILGNVSFE